MKTSTRYWVLFAGPTVTFALGFGLTFDNLNIVKLLALGFFAGFALSEIVMVVRRAPRIVFSPTFTIAFLFLFGLSVPLFFSNSPFSQQIYGASGRNLGFLHYFFLLLIFLGVSIMNYKVTRLKFLTSLVVVGVFEAGYAGLQFLGLDPIPWKNSDKWIFGTFGNPNYLSSFLALSAIATAHMALVEKRKLHKLLGFSAALFQSGVTLLSASTQGLILLAFGFFAFIVILFFQRSRFLGRASFFLGSTMGLLGVLGIFQYGPLSKYLYQDSVSYRGDYWRAGLNMFKDNWAHGVGLDSYGDYYRMYRDGTAANRRGLEVVSNSAHNLFIDLAATGGTFLLLGYLSILGLVLFSIFRVFRSSTKLPLDYKVLVTLWAAFNLQTMISINVSSLAIWGWIFSGLILSYEIEGGTYKSIGRKQWREKSKEFSLLTTTCCSICVFLVAPLVSRDVNLANAFTNNKIPEISRALLTFPRDANQIAEVAIAYEKLGRSKESLELAKQSVILNPNSVSAWQIILSCPVSNTLDKARAKKALGLLDPFYVTEFG